MPVATLGSIIMFQFRDLISDRDMKLWKIEITLNIVYVIFSLKDA